MALQQVRHECNLQEAMRVIQIRGTEVGSFWLCRACGNFWKLVDRDGDLLSWNDEFPEEEVLRRIVNL